MAKGKKYVETDDWKKAFSIFIKEERAETKENRCYYRDGVGCLINLCHKAHLNGWMFDAFTTARPFLLDENGVNDAEKWAADMETAGILTEQDYDDEFNITFPE